MKISSIRKDIEKKNYDQKIENLKELPDTLKKTLKLETNIQLMAKEFLDARGSMFLGKRILFPNSFGRCIKIKGIVLLTC